MHKIFVMIICLLTLSITVGCASNKSKTSQPTQSSSNSLNFLKPNTLTIQSGNNTIQADAYPIWSHDLKTKIAADMQRHTPQEMESSIQYLALDLSGDRQASFTPLFQGKEIYGQYDLYDPHYELIIHNEPSGPAPQTYLFRDLKPGKYIVVLTTTIETKDSKNGYQYFFGVIVPEK